jgi:CRISPR-associated protein Csd2
MNRIDFVVLFDAADANPNGDPDAGNLPRVDPETGHGLVTDVCLKRKVRNYVSMVHGNGSPNRIYFSDGAVLNHLHEEAWVHADLKDQKDKSKLPKDKAKEITDFMTSNFFDIRTFGAVMSTEVNCGQVRGPVQMSFSRSIDPVVTLEHAITRSSVTNERDIEKERTMGRKFTIPYGLYRAHGFVNPFLADQTGFDEEDLDLFFTALQGAFQFDQSAARPAGSMATRRVIVFEHGSKLGQAPSHQLFDAVHVERRPDVEIPRSFADYDVRVDRERVPDGVTVRERV